MKRELILMQIEKMNFWQNFVFSGVLCERMYPNFVFFCRETHFLDPREFRKILDLVWEFLLIKNAKIDFEKQLEKLESIIPDPNEFKIFAVYFAIDACNALSELIHFCLLNEKEEMRSTSKKISEISFKSIELLSNDINYYENNESDYFDEETELQLILQKVLLDKNQLENEFVRDLRLEIRGINVSNVGLN